MKFGITDEYYNEIREKANENFIYDLDKIQAEITKDTGIFLINEGYIAFDFFSGKTGIVRITSYRTIARITDESLSLQRLVDLGLLTERQIYAIRDLIQPH